MPRKNSSPAFDMQTAANTLAELGVKRRQFIKARIRVLNAAGALVRRSLGWRGDLEEAESAAISKKAARVMAAADPGDLPDELAAIAIALKPDIDTARSMALPGEIHQHQIELDMRKIARQFPVWKSWACEVKGFSDLGLAIIIAEAGLLHAYPKKGHLWKRLGFAPYSKDGETRAYSQWRMKGGLSADEWTMAGYSPRRHASIYAQVGGPIIGGMGKGLRPSVGRPLEGNPARYEEMFVARLRYQTERDPEQRRPDTEGGKESFSKQCAEQARYYTTKIFLRDLWREWRRAASAVPAMAIDEVPSADQSNAAQAAGQATPLTLITATGILPDLKSRKAPKGAASAHPEVPQGRAGPADATNADAPRGAGRAGTAMPMKARSKLPSRKSEVVA